MGVKATDLPNITILPTSTNVLAVQRVSGVERMVQIDGVNLAAVNSVGTIQSALLSVGAVTSINSLRITSVNSRVSTVSILAAAGGYNDATISARITSVNSRVATVSALISSYNDAAISARITSVNALISADNADTVSILARISNVSSLAVGGGYNDATISARITSVNNRVASVSGEVTSVNARTLNNYLAFSLHGTPGLSEDFAGHIYGEATNYPTNFAGSYGRILTSAAATLNYSLRKDGVSVATVRVSVGKVTCAFINAASVEFTAGQRISLLSPSVTAASVINLTLKGRRV